MRYFFKYVNLLKKDKPFKWLHDEQRNIHAMVFKFKDKESPRGYISGLVHNLQVR